MPGDVSILIVDDEAPIRSLLSEVLSPQFKCSCAEGAGEALRFIDSQHFDLALVDIGLPGMSGISLCRLIINRSPSTVVIVVSGETDTQTLSEAINAGAADYITKPFELSAVVATVERALGRHKPGAVA